MRVELGTRGFSPEQLRFNPLCAGTGEYSRTERETERSSE